MSPESKSVLSSAFAIVAVIAALIACTIATVTSVSISHSIQHERARSVLDNCQSTNRRHDDTITALNQILDKALRGATPAQRVQIEQSRAPTILMINALAPKRDCAQVVKASVRAAN